MRYTLQGLAHKTNPGDMLSHPGFVNRESDRLLFAGKFRMRGSRESLSLLQE